MSKINKRENFATKLVKVPKEKFKILFETAPIALVEGVWGKTFDVLNVNQSALGLFAAKDKKEFAQHFANFQSKIPLSILLEFLSARVKGDFFETELHLPNFKNKKIYVFMRTAYFPAIHAVGSQHVVLAFIDITERKRTENFLSKIAQVDALTQVFNRRAVLKRLDEELSRAKRYDLNLSCIIFDLDNFKKVNDTFGHLWGDKCMRGAVAALKSSLRKTDIIGRFGGDEFLVILPETNPEQAIIPVKRFMETAKAKMEMQRKGVTMRISFSIGISGFPHNGIETGRDLIKAADQALYISKSSGGNQFNVYNTNINRISH